MSKIAVLRASDESPRTTLENAREIIDDARAVLIVTLPKDRQFIGKVWVCADDFADLAALAVIAQERATSKLRD